MDDSRDEKLVLFMSMIGRDDVSPDVAADILEAHDWNVELALSSVIEGFNDPQPSQSDVINIDDDDFNHQDYQAAFEAESIRQPVSQRASSSEFSDERSLQDEEYREALRRDREQEDAMKREAAKRDEKKVSAEKRKALIPDEPASDDPLRLQVMMRLPDGRRVGRGFKQSDKVESMYCWVEGLGFDLDSFRIVATFPHKVIADFGSTLCDASIANNSVLIVERIA